MTDDVACPFCGSTTVTLDAERGTALCRRLYHCQDCEEPFEQFV